MADTASKTTSSRKKDEPSAKRKMLTPAERVAKLEADLAAARKKAEERDAKQGKALRDKRDKLNVKIEDLQKQVREIDAELERIGDGTVPDPDPIVSPEGVAKDTES